MKRRNWLFGLFGFSVEAQQWQECRPDESKMPLVTGSRILVICDKKIALNNQCPVCGTLAAPFYKPLDWDYYPSGFAGTDRDGHAVPINLARCSRCNAAFWQDAEEPKRDKN